MSRIFFLFFVIFTSFANFSLAEENIYLVEGLSAKSTSKSPAAARNNAIAAARRDGFLILLSRIGLKAKVADDVTDEEISDMVRSEQINDEKIAGSSYSAVLNVVFAKDFVDHILGEKAQIIQSSNQEETYLLIPAEVIKKKVILWEDENDWRKAIEKAVKKDRKSSFIVLEPDISNIATVSAQTIVSADYQKLSSVLARYSASAAYTMFFNYDSIENKVMIDVFYIRKLQKKQVRLSFVNVDRLGYEALLDKVAQKTLEYLSKIQGESQKNMNSNLVQVAIKISELSDWITIKNRIENSSFVNQLDVESISRDHVVIRANYVDGVLSVEESFAKIGLSLNKESENYYTTSAD